MMDKVAGLVALAILAAFLGVVVAFVPEPDLAAVSLIVVAMAAYDLSRSTFRRSNGGRDR